MARWLFGFCPLPPGPLAFLDVYVARGENPILTDFALLSSLKLQPISDLHLPSMFAVMSLPEPFQGPLTRGCSLLPNACSHTHRCAHHLIRRDTSDTVQNAVLGSSALALASIGIVLAYLQLRSMRHPRRPQSDEESGHPALTITAASSRPNFSLGSGFFFLLIKQQHLLPRARSKCTHSILQRAQSLATSHAPHQSIHQPKPSLADRHSDNNHLVHFSASDKRMVTSLLLAKSC